MSIAAPTSVAVVTIVKNLIAEGRMENFIQCMESVLAQDYPNLQYLVKDGNSKDGSLKALQTLSKKHGFKLVSEIDTGVWDAMDKSLNMITSDYLNFMNSDDFFTRSDAVSIAVSKLEESNADWFFSEAYVERKNQTKYMFPTSPWGVFACFGIVHQTIFVRTLTLKKADPFKYSHVTKENFLMMQLLINDAVFAFSKKPLVCYREGGYSTNAYGGNNLETTNKDFADYFFRLAGRNWGMTWQECYDCFGFQLFSKRNILQSLKVIKKFENRNLKLFFVLKLIAHLINTREFRFKRQISSLARFVLKNLGSSNPTDPESPN
jgi:glycosyltransferase involved in cell wall biosynthesis